MSLCLKIAQSCDLVAVCVCPHGRSCFAAFGGDNPFGQDAARLFVAAIAAPGGEGAHLRAIAAVAPYNDLAQIPLPALPVADDFVGIVDVRHAAMGPPDLVAAGDGDS